MTTSSVLRHSCFMVVVISLLFLPALSGAEPPIKIEGGWIQAVPPASADGVAYVKVINQSAQPLQLTAASTPIAGKVLPMFKVREEKNGQEMVGMRPLPALVIPAHGNIELGPEGAHLMLLGLKEHPQVGAKVKLTLHFEPGGIEVTAELPVAMTKP